MYNSYKLQTKNWTCFFSKMLLVYFDIISLAINFWSITNHVRYYYLYPKSNQQNIKKINYNTKSLGL